MHCVVRWSLQMKKVLNERYQLKHVVGEGGMAVTYAALDQLLERDVAVKVMRKQFWADEEFIHRFRREAQAAAKLSHPNICGVFDICQDEDALYIVMELVDGPNLKQVIRQEGPLDEARAAGIGKQVAHALVKAHENRIIHRDIKPHNILIADGGIAKVTDFGIARAVESDSLTKTHAIVGTVQYISPEQARGEPAVYASDLYSLGVVLYEMVTGELPFSGENPVSVALKHAEEEPPAPSERRAGVSRAMEYVIYKALQKSARKRYSSALDMAQDLERIEKGKEVDEDADRTVVLSRPLATGGKKVGAESLDRTMIRPPSVQDVRYDERERTPPRPIERPGSAAMGWVLGILLALVAAGVGLMVAQKAQPELVLVPNLVGRPLSEAEQELSALNLRWSTQGEYHETVPLDHIISQMPRPGEQIEESAVISLTRSLGPQVDLTQVPDVTNMAVAAAKRTLMNQGLLLGGTTEEFNTTVAKGNVIRQSPSAGHMIEKNMPVDLSISKGEKPPPPPPPPPASQDVEGAIEYTIPDSGPDEMTFRVVTVDQDGNEKTVYDRAHAPGESVSVKVRGKGKTTVRWYLQDNLVGEKELVPE